MKIERTTVFYIKFHSLNSVALHPSAVVLLQLVYCKNVYIIPSRFYGPQTNDSTNWDGHIGIRVDRFTFLPQLIKIA